MDPLLGTNLVGYKWVFKNKYRSYCASDFDPEKDLMMQSSNSSSSIMENGAMENMNRAMVIISQRKVLHHGHSQPKASTCSKTKLSEVMHAIESITSNIESLDPIDKQVAISHLQKCIVFLQLGSDIPQLDGNTDQVIFCDLCNLEFLGNNRGRDRQTHYINEHFQSNFDECTPSKSDNYFKCNESGCQFKATRKLDFWRHKGGKHGYIDQLLQEHFHQNPPLIPANGSVTPEARRDHEHEMVTEKSQGDGGDRAVEKVRTGDEKSPRLGVPQSGDGISPSSDESETTGGSGGGYNRNTDIKVSGNYASLALQVRQRNEPALNKMEASVAEAGRPGGSGHSSYTATEENEHNKPWSAAVLNRDVSSSKTDLSIIDEPSSYSDQHLDPHRGLSPLAPPFERGHGSGAARDSDRTNPFARDANRLSVQTGREVGRCLEASEPSDSRQNSNGLDDIGLGYQQDSRRGSQKVRREPLGGSSPLQPQPNQNIDKSKLTRFIIQSEIRPLDIHAFSTTKCPERGQEV